MVIGNKWFYILLGSLFSILVIINFALWTTEEGFGADMADGAIGAISGGHPTTYIGFKGLFDMLGTFPGPAMTIESLNTWCNVFTNFDLTGIQVLDYFVAIFRLITGPIYAGVCIVGDILINLIWIFRVIFVNGWYNIFQQHESQYDMPINYVNSIYQYLN